MLKLKRVIKHFDELGTNDYPSCKPVRNWTQDSWDFSGNVGKTKQVTSFKADLWKQVCYSCNPLTHGLSLGRPKILMLLLFFSADLYLPNFFFKPVSVSLF